MEENEVGVGIAGRKPSSSEAGEGFQGGNRERNERATFDPSLKRLPKRSGRPLFTDWLLARKINAFAFFMDEDLLQTIVANGFKNDSNRALHDLQSQLPKPIRNELWPQKTLFTPAKSPPANTEQQEDDEQDDSATSLMGISMALPTSKPHPQPIRVPKQDQEEQDRSRGISI